MPLTQIRRCERLIPSRFATKSAIFRPKVAKIGHFRPVLTFPGTIRLVFDIGLLGYSWRQSGLLSRLKVYFWSFLPFRTSFDHFSGLFQLFRSFPLSGISSLLVSGFHSWSPVSTFGLRFPLWSPVSSLHSWSPVSSLQAPGALKEMELAH